MTTDKNETIVLHDMSGIARRNAIDTNGNTWVEFEVDYFAEQEKGTCAICGAELEFGWLCLDGGDEVCREHMEYEVIK